MTNSPGTWPCLTYADAPAALRFLTDVLGFEQRAVHAGDDGRAVAHAELRWPEGGGVMLGSPRTAAPDVPPGTGMVYVQTADPDAVHARALAAGADVVQGLTEQPYGSRECAVRDPEGVIWSFGTYAGE
jgi:uncharacterized glyoxalase superfamily protein PhnB